MTSMAVLEILEAPENLVLINRSSGGNWLEVQLTGTESNASAIGARIEVTPSAGGATRLIREAQSHTGWRSQSDLFQRFGLGSVDTVDVVVRWLSGMEDRVTGVAANQRIVVVEGSQERSKTEVLVARNQRSL